MLIPCRGKNHEGPLLLEATPENFRRCRDNKSGLDTVCKRCQGVKSRTHSGFSQAVMRAATKDFHSLWAGVSSGRDLEELSATVLYERTLHMRGESGHKFSAMVECLKERINKAVLTGMVTQDDASALFTCVEYINKYGEMYRGLFDSDPVAPAHASR